MKITSLQQLFAATVLAIVAVFAQATVSHAITVDANGTITYIDFLGTDVLVEGKGPTTLAMGNLSEAPLGGHTPPGGFTVAESNTGPGGTLIFDAAATLNDNSTATVRSSYTMSHTPGTTTTITWDVTGPGTNGTYAFGIWTGGDSTGNDPRDKNQLMISNLSAYLSTAGTNMSLDSQQGQMDEGALTGNTDVKLVITGTNLGSDLRYQFFYDNVAKTGDNLFASGDLSTFGVFSTMRSDDNEGSLAAITMLVQGDVAPVSPAPEPSSFILAAMGLVGLCVRRRRRVRG